MFDVHIESRAAGVRVVGLGQVQAQAQAQAQAWAWAQVQVQVPVPTMVDCFRCPVSGRPRSMSKPLFGLGRAESLLLLLLLLLLEESGEG